MKYTCEVLIDLPRGRVIELFDDQDNLYKWQKGLKSMEAISGQPGQDGLKSKMIYDMKGKEVIMVETVEAFDFPGKMIATYEAKNVWNRCVNIFEDLGDQTRWQMESEFVCGGLMRLMTLFGKGMFKKQTQSDMLAFKAFAEGENRS